MKMYISARGIWARLEEKINKKYKCTHALTTTPPHHKKINFINDVFFISMFFTFWIVYWYKTNI